jgi:peptidoglycan/LPS O-acetylase OafA/YrhL
MTSRAKLADILNADENSFNLVRIAAALAVLVSHSFLLLAGPDHVEPLGASTPFTLGQHAVNAFFVISGLTLSHSLARNRNLMHYAWARCLRIFPALLGYGLLFALVAGPLLTTWSRLDYFTDAHTWFYPAAVLMQFARATPPPGIFSNLPIADAANNPLWTIKYEIAAYVGLAIVFGLGLFRRTGALLLSLLAAAAIFLLAGEFLREARESAPAYQLGRYGFCFLLGVVAYHFRQQFSLSPWLLALTAGLVVALHGTALEPAAYVVLTAHLVLIAGSLDYGLFTLLTRKSDLSYGTYIYGWPIQQSLIVLIPGLGVAALLLLSVIIAPVFALVSWSLVEKPALRLKRYQGWPQWGRDCGTPHKITGNEASLTYPVLPAAASAILASRYRWKP